MTEREKILNRISNAERELEIAKKALDDYDAIKTQNIDRFNGKFYKEKNGVSTFYYYVIDVLSITNNTVNFRGTSLSIMLTMMTHSVSYYNGLIHRSIEDMNNFKEITKEEFNKAIARNNNFTAI